MYSLLNYGDMIRDEGRTRPYVEALRRAVRPGSVVADIGTGTGFFALVACRLGARRVYAIEPSDAIALGREIAAANGLADRIEFIQSISMDVELPERADVVVAEIHGILPLFERYIPTLIDARRRLLAPGGALIPARESLWLAAVEAPDLYRRIAGPWGEGILGIDMSAGRALLTSDLCRAEFGPRDLITDPACGMVLDYSRIETADADFGARLTARRDAMMHGLALWFDATLAEGIEMSNAPGRPRLIFGNAFLPWPEAVQVRAGDIVDAALSAKLTGDRYLWSWRSTLSRQGREWKSFRQSQFFAMPLDPSRLRRRAASHVAQLSEDGEIERLILQRMAARRTLGDIARELVSLHPARFRDWHEALAHVGDASIRHGA